MKYSTDRILTTHAGALPQPADLKEMHNAQVAGRPIDQDAFTTRVRGAVADVVKKQIACGLDIINDGEVGKSNFSRYARDRLSGFVEREVKASDQGIDDLCQGPNRVQRLFRSTTYPRGDNINAVFCNAPLKYIGHESLKAEIADFKAGLQGQKYEEAFLPAIAPGTIEHWMKNDYYPNDETYLVAIADAMHEEYKAIVDAGFLLQDRRSRFAGRMAVHVEDDRAGVSQIRRAESRRAQPLSARHPARSHSLPYLLGQLPRPA
jgi:5-methyltetrahydropteroyltriglutamate--homocysteine methyltransferase